MKPAGQNTETPPKAACAWDEFGRACCAYCRTEYDAHRLRGCPICRLSGRLAASNPGKPAKEPNAS